MEHGTLPGRIGNKGRLTNDRTFGGCMSKAVTIASQVAEFGIFFGAMGLMAMGMLLLR